MTHKMKNEKEKCNFAKPEKHVLSTTSIQMEIFLFLKKNQCSWLQDQLKLYLVLEREIKGELERGN